MDTDDNQEEDQQEQEEQEDNQWTVKNSANKKKQTQATVSYRDTAKYRKNTEIRQTKMNYSKALLTNTSTGKADNEPGDVRSAYLKGRRNSLPRASKNLN